MFAYAVVDAFIVAAKDDYIFKHRHAVGYLLVEHFAVGSREYDFVIMALGFEGRDAAVDGFDLHDHACIASEGIVVDFAMFVCCVISQIVNRDLDQAFVLSAFEYRATEG